MQNLSNLPLVYFRLSLHCPAPTRKASAKEQKLADEAKAEKGAYRVQQERIPEKWHKPIASVQAKIRQYFEKNAFRINDTYAIPVSQYETFEQGYQGLIAEHDVQVNSLCEAIASGDIVKEAMRRMGNDFNADFLPSSCDNVKQAIRISIRMVGNLDSEVLRNALSDLATDTAKEVEERIREDQKIAESEGQANVVSFVLDEIVEYLKDIQTRVGAGEKRTHYQTLIKKFDRITEKLPSYNVTENPVIANAIERIQEAFRTLDKGMLKDSAEYRADTVAKATEILKGIKTPPPAIQIPVNPDTQIQGGANLF